MPRQMLERTHGAPTKQRLQVARSVARGHNEAMSSWMPYLTFATSLAAECSEYALSQFGLHPARRKHDGTLVTETDLFIDRLIVRRLADAYPAHRVLSEEQTTSYDAAAEFTWVVDPVDGTTNFARGMPVWGVSVALLQHGRPVAGVIDFPMIQERFTAAAGAGAWRNGEAIHTADNDLADDELLMMKCTRTDKLFDVRLPLKARIYGSAAYHLCKVADGSALAGIEATPKVWDLAAAYLLVVEAGGMATTWQRAPIFPLAAESRDYADVATPIFVAANQAIQDALFAGVTVRGA